MDFAQTIALALGSSWASGINLYAAVFTLGLLGRFGSVPLPGSLEVVMHPWVIATAGVLYAIEFFADKVPYVDSAWDAVHTFIRIPAGAILAWSAFSGQSGPEQAIAVLIGGSLAAGSHATKASTRLALNTSPEPITNIVASLVEDVISFGTVLLSYFLPILALIAIILMAIVSAVVLPKAFRAARYIVRVLLGRRSQSATTGDRRT